jgi:hypothetical protein
MSPTRALAAERIQSLAITLNDLPGSYKQGRRSNSRRIGGNEGLAGLLRRRLWMHMLPVHHAISTTRFRHVERIVCSLDQISELAG